MAPLPEDIMLIIIGHLDIDTFLGFRLSCRSYYELINSHINGVAESVAQATCFAPLPGYLAEKSKEKMTVAGRLRWLKWQRNYEMASILLEHLPRGSVAAGDPLGDDFREFVAKGWHALACLAKISQEAEAMSLDEPPEAVILGSEGAGEAHEMIKSPAATRQLVVTARWLREVETWPLEQIKAFDWLDHALLHYVFGFRDPRVYWYNQKEWDGPRWVSWWIATQGPAAFWKGWYNGTEVSSIKTALEHDWQTRDPSEVPWLLESHRTIERQIKIILRDVKYAVVYSRTAATRRQLQRPQGHRVQIVQRPDIYHVAKQRASLTAAGDPEPAKCFHHISFNQDLEWTLFGIDLEAEEAKAQQWREEQRAERERRRGRAVAHCSFPHAKPKPALHPDFERLLKEWEGAWLQKIADAVPAASPSALQTCPAVASSSASG